uniref:Uncharacterized protein n=1 Tax=Anguilla anguilla TaxID=7936 RepID=A0A0E9VJE7_ANGAN
MCIFFFIQRLMLRCAIVHANAMAAVLD